MAAHAMNVGAPRRRPWVKAVRVLGFPLLGPVYILPMAFWGAVDQRFRSPGLRRAAAALAIYAGALGLLLTGLRPFGGSASRLALSLQGWSPWHALARELFLGLANAGVSTPTVAYAQLGICWLSIAASCTVLLAPLYLWLLERRRRAS